MKKLHYVKPTQLKYELSLEEVNQHRKIDCLFYDICLDTTSARNWRSYSCCNCDVYVPDLEQYEDGCKELHLLLLIKKPLRYSLQVETKPLRYLLQTK